MSANIDASTLLTIRGKKPRAGSCITPELIAEIVSLLEIEFKAEFDPTAVKMKVSTESNNLAALDSNGAILVAAVLQFEDEKSWLAGVTTELTFDGWQGLGIDAEQAFLNIRIMVDTGEAGVVVKKDPTGTANVRPNYEITSLTSSQLKIKVYNLASDAAIVLKLVQFPTAADSSS